MIKKPQILAETPSKKRKMPVAIVLVLLVFLGVLVMAVGMAYSRRSGNTGLDMSKIHHLRLNAQ